MGARFISICGNISFSLILGANTMTRWSLSMNVLILQNLNSGRVACIGSIVNLNLSRRWFKCKLKVIVSCGFWRYIECENTFLFSLCQKNLWNACVSISELRHSVTLKRIQLRLLKQKLKLASILRGQVRI